MNEFDPTDPATWPQLLGLKLIVKDQKRNYPGIVPVCRATWLAGVRDGYYPAPVKLGPKLNAWRKPKILDVVKNGASRRRRRST
jgi:prophage regulatory protein